jgi:inner membrane protein
MDPVTHGLTGLLLAQAGFQRRYGAQATLALVGGALIPDIDVLWSPSHDVIALETHRGITHSFVGALVLGVAMGFLLRFLGPEKRWKLLSGLSILGIVVGHLFMDLITAYGIQLFLPLSRARPAWDLIFIIDPFLSVPLLLAAVAALFWRTERVRLGRFGLSYLAVYLLFLAVTHSHALIAMDRTLTAQGVDASRVAALPVFLNPLKRFAIAEADSRYWRATVQFPSGAVEFHDPVPTGMQNNLVAQSRSLKAVQTYLWFARFPVATVSEADGRRVVEFKDLRFTQNLRGDASFLLLRVIFNRSGVADQIIFNR